MWLHGLLWSYTIESKLSLSPLWALFFESFTTLSPFQQKRWRSCPFPRVCLMVSELRKHNSVRFALTLIGYTTHTVCAWHVILQRKGPEVKAFIHQLSFPMWRDLYTCFLFSNNHGCSLEKKSLQCCKPETCLQLQLWPVETFASKCADFIFFLVSFC